MFFPFKSKDVIGLDIGSGFLKAVKLKKSKIDYELELFEFIPILPDTIIDGAVNEPERLVEALKELNKKAGFGTKKVVISISGHSSVIMKRISIPEMTEEELNESIRFEAEQYMPFDIDEVNLDFQIIGPSIEEEGQMEVILVAVKKDIIAEYVKAVTDAGLHPVIVDIDAFAIENMYEINYDIEEGSNIALIHVGAGSILINILKNGVAAVARESSMGSNVHTEAISSEFQIPYEAAEKLKKGEAVEGISPEDAETVIQNASEEIIAEIVRSLEYFMTTFSNENIQEIVLSGGGALIKGFDELLSERTGITVRIANPFMNIRPGKKIDRALIEDIGPLAAVAVGLALRRVDDR